MGKFLSFIGLEDVDDDELLEEEEEKQPKAAAPARPRQRKESASRPAQNNDPVTPQNIADMKMIVFHPVAYDDAQSIADNLKSHKPIIVNMEELDGNTAQRVLDFLLGAVYALDGTISKISRGIFLVAPKNCDVVDNGEDGYTDL
ncbi:MAG: cell division protein SepF [Clostridia bacterium]|nr:cell division protein SepF [Clostridia bacterium]